MMAGEMVLFLYNVTTLKLATLCSQITKRPRSFGGPTRFVVGEMLLTGASEASACQEHFPNHKPCWTPLRYATGHSSSSLGGLRPPRPPCTLTLTLPHTCTASKNTFFFSLLFEKLKFGGI